MATTRVRATMAALVAAAGLLILAAPVEALSCEAHPDASPEEITFGDVEIAGGEDFFTRYDVAVIGTATEVEGHAAARVWVTLEVTVAIGVDEIPATVVIVSPDFDDMGYPFVVGSDYFVPARRWTSGICDPIAQLDDAETSAIALTARAQRANLAAATPTDPTSTGGAAPPDGNGIRGWVPAAAVLGLIVATGLLIPARQRHG